MDKSTLAVEMHAEERMPKNAMNSLDWKQRNEGITRQQHALHYIS